MSCKYRANSNGESRSTAVTTGRHISALNRYFNSGSQVTGPHKISLPSWPCGFDSRHPLRLMCWSGGPAAGGPPAQVSLVPLSCPY